MTAKQFIDGLRSFGFDEIDQLIERRINELFSNQNTAIFATSLASNFGNLEVLSDQELSDFESLKCGDKPILEVDEIMKYLPREESKVGDKRSRIPIRIEEVTGEEKRAVDSNVTIVLKKKKLLSNLSAEVEEKTRILEKRLEETNVQLKKTFDSAKNKSLQVDQKLSEVNESLLDLLKAYEDTSYFLSQLKSQEYFEEEDNFTVALTTYTKKQFFEGIADIVGTSDKSRYALLEINKPEHLLIKGEDEQVIREQSKELLRLQSLFSKSERNCIESCSSLKVVEAELQEVERQLSEIVLSPMYNVRDNSEAHDRELDKKLTIEKEEMLKLVQDDLFPLLDKLGQLESTTILSGNYDLKIARQDYFLSKQDEVIDQLIVQSARYDFLSMLFEVEAKTHRHVYHLLTAMKELVESSRRSAQKRIQVMESQYFQKDDKTRETIDSRDTVMCSLYDMIESPAETKHQELFKSYHVLRDRVDKMNQKQKQLQENDFVLHQECNSLVECMEKKASNCHQLIFGDPNSAGSHDAIDLCSKADELEESLATIETSVKELIKDIDSKKKTLSTDSLKALERTLFPIFFHDPIRLKRLMGELETRVQAITIV